MGKRSDRLPKKTPDRREPATEAPPPPAPKVSRFNSVPLWGWVLVFCVPVLSSEYMFHMVGKTGEMILFPIAWIGFWIALMQRSGWPILKRRKEGSGTER